MPYKCCVDKYLFETVIFLLHIWQGNKKFKRGTHIGFLFDGFIGWWQYYDRWWQYL